MAIQKFKVIIEVIETKYFEKIFDFNSVDFYEEDEEIPTNMYDEIPELLEEEIIEDFFNDSDSWTWNEPAIGSGDGFFIESIELINPSGSHKLSG